MKHVLIGLAFLILAVSGSSCVRPSVTTSEKKDSTLVKKRDSTGTKLADQKAPEKVREVIKEVFIEVFKDCPELNKVEPDGTTKGQKLEKRIRDNANLNKMTGGWIFAKSDKIGTEVTIKFTGDQSTAYWNSRSYQITKTVTIEKVYTLSIFRQVLNTWFMWVPLFGFFILWAVVRFK